MLSRQADFFDLSAGPPLRPWDLSLPSFLGTGARRDCQGGAPRWTNDLDRRPAAGPRRIPRTRTSPKGPSAPGGLLSAGRNKRRALKMKIPSFAAKDGILFWIGGGSGAGTRQSPSCQRAPTAVGVTDLATWIEQSTLPPQDHTKRQPSSAVLFYVIKRGFVKKNRAKGVFEILPGLSPGL